MRRTSPVHVHQMSLLARPRTPLMTEWVAALNATLDAAEGLVQDPGTARYGAPGYPLEWTDVLGKASTPCASSMPTMCATTRTFASGRVATSERRNLALVERQEVPGRDP